jgi:hypothetical protein
MRRWYLIMLLVVGDGILLALVLNSIFSWQINHHLLVKNLDKYRI